MKKITLLVLLAIYLFSISACSTREVDKFDNQSNAHLNQLENIEMPTPFSDLNGFGGGFENSSFFLPFSNGTETKIDIIPWHIITPFMEADVFMEWAENNENKSAFDEPQTDLMGYVNIYSYIETFNIPADKLREIMIQNEEVRREAGLADRYTRDEINLIVSRDEFAIMNHFVSDFSIYHDGKVFTPHWFYVNTHEDYEAAGITPEMLEEKLDLYAEFSFTAEAAEAFEAKLSEFMETDVVLDRVSQ
ncbi:MAG: hypothetical protein FWE74_08870 [Oscillospiraceae bacterium]|nr:hypothetical protein [Oscillospiraceae bacterium]